jgi:hypothetical protein
MLVIQKGASTLYNKLRETAIVHYSSELSKRDLTVAQVELGVDVAHEDVADDPEVGTDILAHDPADALRRAGGDMPEAEGVRRDGELLAAEGEADVRRAVARVRVVAAADACAARHRFVELGGVGGRGNDERGAATFNAVRAHKREKGRRRLTCR